MIEINTAIKLAFFSLLLNFSILLILQVYGQDYLCGMGLCENMRTNVSETINPFLSKLNTSISPGGELKDTSFSTFRLIDLTTIGFIQSLINIVNSVLYGWTTFITNVFAPIIDASTLNMIRWAMNSIVSIGYFLAAIALFTNRDLQS